MPETMLPVHPASSLKPGAIIKFHDRELTITGSSHYERWITLRFDMPWWDAISKQMRFTYGCHPGFCFEVIQL